MSKPVVHLRVYRSKNGSKEISYNANGQIQNENSLVKEIYNTLEWKNYLRHIGVHGFIKVVVEKVMLNGESQPTEAIQKEVDNAMNPTANVPLTPEQKQIAELKAMVEALTSGNKPKKEAQSKDYVIQDIGGEREFAPRNEVAPVLPEGKLLEDLKRGELEELFPNVSALEPKNKAEFIAHVIEKYPNLK